MNLTENYLQHIDEGNTSTKISLDALDALWTRYGTKMNRYVHKKCGKLLQEDLKRICKVRVKLEFKKKYLAELQSKRSLCNNAKNKVKCNKAITQKMNWARMDIRTLETTFKQLTRERQKRIAMKKLSKQYDKERRSK